MKSSSQVTATTHQTPSESNSFNASRRRFLHTGTGVGLTAVASLFMPASGWFLLGQAHAADVSPSSPVILNISVSSRSGRVGFAKQQITILPFASFIWLVQQMHWRTRGFEVTNTMPAIRALTPQQAQVIYNHLILDYVGNALVAGSFWHEQIRKALEIHKAGFIPPVDPSGKQYIPTKPGDGLYPVDVNEALEWAADRGWKGKPDDGGAGALKKRLEERAQNLGAYGHASDDFGGLTPVINFWTGEMSLFPGSAADDLLGGGYTGGGNGGRMVDTSPASPGSSDRNNGNAWFGSAVAGAVGAVAGAKISGLAGATLGAKLAVGAGLAGATLALGYVAYNAGQLIAEGDFKDEQAKQDEEARLDAKLRGGSSGGGTKIPSGTDQDPPPDRVHIPSSTEISNSYRKDFRNRRVGIDRFEYDLSKTQNVAIAARQAFDQLKESMFWSLAWRQSVTEEMLKADDTGQLYRDWLRKNILTKGVSDGTGAYDPAKDETDTLGKPPSIPPRAVALTFDAQIPVMSSGTKDITLQIQVLR